MSASGRNFAILGLGAIAAAILAAGGFFLFFQNKEPDQDVLLAALQRELPAYWSVSSIEIDATAVDEAEDPPVFRQRFVAIAAPSEDLFVHDSHETGVEPFVALELKRRRLEDVRLHGIADSRQNNESWQTSIELENPVLEFGVPISRFAGPALVPGSDDALRIRSELGNIASLIDGQADLEWNWIGGAPGRLSGGPDEFAIWHAIERELPAFFVLRWVDISSTLRRFGEEDGPVYRQEFKATVAPNEPLYSPVRDGELISPFLEIERVAIPTAAFELWGTAMSRNSGNAWVTEIQFVDAAANLGLPRSGYSRPVIVSGSEEATKTASKLASVRLATERVAKAPWVSMGQLGNQ